MNDIIMWIIIGAVALIALVILIIFIVKLCKMKPEERKELLITWLKGAVALAEEKIGSGNGPQKLEEVEKYFNEHAPWFLKIIFKISGFTSLEDLIEEALESIKNSFGGDNNKNSGDKEE